MPTLTRKQCRNGDACDPKTEAEAIDCLAHHSVDADGRPYTIARLAAHIGKPEAWLRKATSLYDDQHPAPRMNYIRALTMLTKNFVVYRFYARDAGGAFMQLPEVVNDATADVMVKAAKSMGEFSEFMTEVSVRSTNGFCDDDVARIAREGHEAIEHIGTVIAAVTTHAAKASQGGALRVVSGGGRS